MKIILIYVSPNTTTKAITEEFKNLLPLYGHQVTVLNIGEKENRQHEKIDLRLFEGIDLIGIGSPIYHLSLVEPMERFLNGLLPRLSEINPHIRAFAYLTYCGITTGKAFSNTVRLLKKNQIGLVGAVKIKAPHFLNVEGYPDESAKETVRLLCTRLSETDYRTMSWDKAEALFRKRKTVINILYPFRKIIGKLRQQPISISPGLCTKCHKCADQCPVNAIKINPYAMRDSKKCIYCYHCATICPRKAIHCRVEQVYKTIELNKKIVGTETPPNDIYL